MDDLPSILQDSYGLKSKGKAAPMGFSRKSSGSNLQHQSTNEYGRTSPVSGVHTAMSLDDDLFWNSTRKSEASNQSKLKQPSDYGGDGLFSGSHKSDNTVSATSKSAAASRKYTDPFAQEDFFSSFSTGNAAKKDPKGYNGGRSGAVPSASAFDDFMDGADFTGHSRGTSAADQNSSPLKDDIFGAFSEKTRMHMPDPPNHTDPFGDFPTGSKANSSELNSESPFGEPFVASKKGTSTEVPPFPGFADFNGYPQADIPEAKKTSHIDSTEQPKPSREDFAGRKGAGIFFQDDSQQHTKGQSEGTKGGTEGFPHKAAEPESQVPFEEEEVWLTVDQIVLVTEPCEMPPPTRPPPPIGAQQMQSQKYTMKPDQTHAHTGEHRSFKSEESEPKKNPSSKTSKSEKQPSERPVFPGFSEDYYSTGSSNARQKSSQKRDSDLPPPSYYDSVGPDDLDNLEDFGRGNFGRKKGSGFSADRDTDFKESAEAAGQSAAAMKEALERARVKAETARKSREKERESEEAEVSAMAKESEKERRKSRSRSAPQDTFSPTENKANAEPVDSRGKSAQKTPETYDMDDFFSGGPKRESSKPKRDTRAKQDKGTTNVNEGGSRSTQEPVRKSAPSFPEAPQSPAPAPSPTAAAPMAANTVDSWADILGGPGAQIPPPAQNDKAVPGESEERRKLRLDRERRVAEKAAKALQEKSRRDAEVLREQAERDRASDVLDIEIKKWAAGKQGNLRALLSTLQFVLWPECNWKPVSLTDLIGGNEVKKCYRKATLCVHPDKVQQKGATIQQKYIAEKVFDLLQEAWNKFNSEELF